MWCIYNAEGRLVAYEEDTFMAMQMARAMGGKAIWQC